MHLKRIIGSVTAVVAVTAAVALYTVHPAKSSDHQDTFNLATRSNTSADITDVFVFPAADNPNNVVFAMNVSPLIMPGQGTTKFFDPTLMWQFKIAHGASNFQEDQVIQLGVSGTGTSQVISLHGPAAPNEVGTANTFTATTGTAPYNTATTLPSGVELFAGPRTDVFDFDLFAFFTFLGDRNYGTHTSQSDPGPETGSNPEGISNGDTASNIQPLVQKFEPGDLTASPTTPSFNGFAAGTMSGVGSPLGNYACSTNPAADVLDAGPFNVLTFVVEVPKSLITAGFNTSTIHVWATASSSTGS